MTLRQPGGDVVIVGAGLIGLSIAFELAQRGAVVRVYDRGEPAHAASWAGAGMLAPHTEHLEDSALQTLCMRSLAEYPSFVERIRAASGIDPRLHLDGIVHAAFDESAFERLRARGASLAQRGVACEMLGRTQALRAEPSLGGHLRGALVVEGEGSVDNRRLGRALAAACDRQGICIARVAWLRVECDARRVLGVRTEIGFVAAASVVNACGAWASQLEGVPVQALPAVEPVKGQMLALEMPAGFVRRTIWVPGAYLVPRDDGRLLVGATSERAGFDTRVTAGGIRSLLDAALAAAPALGAFTVSETWAGLRPATPGGRPFIGPAPLEGLFDATGHYRNGILLAPVTARLAADVIEGKPAPELDAFSRMSRA
jgi:glycine oxidase